MLWKSVLHLGWTVKVMLMENLLTQTPKKGAWFGVWRAYWLLNSVFSAGLHLYHCSRLEGPWISKSLLFFNFWSCERPKHFVCVVFSPPPAAEDRVPLTGVPTKLTGEVTGDNRLLHQLPEDNEDFGWNQIAFDVYVCFMPLLKAFWELLHL